MLDLKTFSANFSSLNAIRSSVLPPPLAIIITSGILLELFSDVETTFKKLGFETTSFISSGDWALGVFSHI